MPPFAPPNIRSVNAIILTQITDSVSFGIILISLVKSGKKREMTFPKKYLFKSIWVILPLSIVGSVLVYFYTCKLSLIIISYALILYPIVKSINGDRLFRNPIVSGFTSIVASMTAFNQPAFDSYSHKEPVSPFSNEFRAFFQLFTITLLSGITNLWLSEYRFVSLLSLSTIIFSVAGSVFGRFAGGIIQVKIKPNTIDTLYHVFLTVLGIVGFSYVISNIRI